MSKPANCYCSPLLSCGVCLANAKPYFFTPGPAQYPWQAGWGND